ncbi:MAG: glycosyltransferase family 4 protein, partial [Ignavibacteriales bacterium]|nr:glycosyltransferase family 4 protein [Ignavibacteriales bacterium]
KLFGSMAIKNSRGIDLRRLGIFPFVFLLLTRRVDIIHIVTFERFAVIAIFLKQIIKTPISFTVHGIVRYQHRTFHTYSTYSQKIKDYLSESLFFRFSDVLFFLSERSIRIASGFYRIPPDAAVIISNGIDYVFSQPKPTHQKDSAGISIVFVGDPARPEKGFSFLLEGLHQCKHKAHVFVICEKIPDQSFNLPDGIQVDFLCKMRTPEYAAFLRDKDIFVSASSYDQFSICAVEAMSAGLVPLVTAETGMSRHIAQGVNGFVVPYGDERELGRLLDVLIVDRPRLKEMSSKSRSIYPTLTWSNIAKEYIAHYQKLLSGRDANNLVDRRRRFHWGRSC